MEIKLDLNDVKIVNISGCASVLLVTTIARTFCLVVSLQVGCTFLGEGGFVPPHN